MQEKNTKTQCLERRDNARRERADFYLRSHMLLILLAAIAVTVVEIISESAFRQLLMALFAAVVIGGVLFSYWLAGKWVEKYYPLQDCEQGLASDHADDLSK